MKKVMGLMALGLSMILLSGCSEDNDTQRIPRIQGTVVGSHYEGASVCVDSNSNDRCDDDETITVSDANGYWSLVILECITCLHMRQVFKLQS